MRDIELVKFTVGGTDYQYYNVETPGLYAGWEPEVGLSRRGIKQSQDSGQSKTTISVGPSNPVALLLRDDSPQSSIDVVIYQADLGDIAGTIEQVWTGKVRSAKWSGAGWDLPCSPSTARDQRSIPRGRWSVNQCRHGIYTRGCGADKSASAQEGDIDAVTKADLEVEITFDAAQSLTSTFNGGILEAADGATAPVVSGNDVNNLFDFRVTLAYWIDSLAAGQPVTVYPGCNHTMGDCADRFSNIENFGGFPLIPEDTGGQ